MIVSQTTPKFIKMVHNFAMPLFVDGNTKQWPSKTSKHPRATNTQLETYMKIPRTPKGQNKLLVGTNILMDLQI